MDVGVEILAYRWLPGAACENSIVGRWEWDEGDWF
jgi:hypothetical protein